MPPGGQVLEERVKAVSSFIGGEVMTLEVGEVFDRSAYRDMVLYYGESLEPVEKLGWYTRVNPVYGHAHFFQIF
jgi:hypothetical protein